MKLNSIISKRTKLILTLPGGYILNGAIVSITAVS